MKILKWIIIVIIFILSLVWIFLWWLKHSDYRIFSQLYTNKQYELILSTFPYIAHSSEHYHNLGNTSYNLYDTSKDNIEHLKNAQTYYAQSLNIEEHEDTRYNYELVSKLINEFPRKKEEENNGDGKSGDQGKKQDDEKSKKSGSGSNIADSPRDKEYYLNENDTIETLSDDQRRELDAYIESLKSQQEHFQKYFGKKKQEQDFWKNMIESIFWDLGNESNKDW